MGESCRKQATLHDVARLAQVSHQTVSRVINDSPNVAADTRERVKIAIEELQYRPNRAARSLITGRSQTLHIIDFEAGYVTPIPNMVCAADGLGYRCGISILTEPTREAFYDLLEELACFVVDGYILFVPQLDLDSDDLRTRMRGIPYVQLGGAPKEGVPALVFDQAAGMRLVLDYLHGLGHTRIAELSGALNTYDGCVRHKTYLEWMQEKQLVPGPSVEGSFAMDIAHERAGDLIRMGGFTAVASGNDNTALGLMHALHSAQYQIPDDISVVGFDDRLMARYFEPALTTVRQDFGLLSRLGMENLISRIENPDLPAQTIVVQPELVIRESAAPPR